MLSYACWMCNLPNIIEVIHRVNSTCQYSFEAFATQPVPYIIKKNKGADRISSAPMKDLGLERELQVKPYIYGSVKVV